MFLCNIYAKINALFQARRRKGVSVPHCCQMRDVAQKDYLDNTTRRRSDDYEEDTEAESESFGDRLPKARIRWHGSDGSGQWK